MSQLHHSVHESGQACVREGHRASRDRNEGLLCQRRCPVLTGSPCVCLNPGLVSSVLFPQSVRVLSWKGAPRRHCKSLKTSLLLQTELCCHRTALPLCCGSSARQLSMPLHPTSHAMSFTTLLYKPSWMELLFTTDSDQRNCCAFRGQHLPTPAEASCIKTSPLTETKRNINGQKIKEMKKQNTQKTEVTHCG